MRGKTSTQEQGMSQAPSCAARAHTICHFTPTPVLSYPIPVVLKYLLLCTLLFREERQNF